MLFDEPIKTYNAKRPSEGKTRREVIRSLKRYIAHSLFRKLVARVGKNRRSVDKLVPRYSTSGFRPPRPSCE